MRSKYFTAVVAIGAAAAMTFVPVRAQAQNAGSFLGGIAGGVLGGMIAGSMAAHARPRTVVVYGRPRYVRAAARPRVARARTGAPAAPRNAQVVNASADPFAKTSAPVTTAISNGR